MTLQHEQHDRGEQVADRHSRLRERRPEAALLVGRVLGDEQHAAAPLAANREAQEEAQDDQQRRSPVADLGERGEAAHQEGRGADQDDCEPQQLLATVLVAEVSEDDASQRTSDEADRVGQERGGDRRIRIVAGREEEDVEDDRRRGGVQEELLPLDDGACHRGGDDFAEPLAGVIPRRVGDGLGHAYLLERALDCAVEEPNMTMTSCLWIGSRNAEAGECLSTLPLRRSSLSVVCARSEHDLVPARHGRARAALAPGDGSGACGALRALVGGGGC